MKNNGGAALPDVLKRLHIDISNHLVAIEDLFKDQVYVTLIVRNPNHANRDVYLSNDPDEPAALGVPAMLLQEDSDHA